LRSIERAADARGRPWVAGLWLAGLGYQYWFYGVFAAIVALAWGRRAVVPLAVAAVLVAPVAVPLLIELEQGVPGLLDPDHPTLLLHSFQPLHGVTGWIDGRHFVASQRAFPLALVVALFGLYRRPRHLVAGAALLVL